MDKSRRRKQWAGRLKGVGRFFVETYRIVQSKSTGFTTSEAREFWRGMYVHKPLGDTAGAMKMERGSILQQLVTSATIVDGTRIFPARIEGNNLAVKQ